MNIPTAQLIGSPKEIGKFKDMPVMEVSTIGGLSLVFAVKKGGATQTLGVASHKAIARHIASKENPDLELTELSKSEDLPTWLIEQLAKTEGSSELTKVFQAAEAELNEK